MLTLTPLQSISRWQRISILRKMKLAALLSLYFGCGITQHFLQYTILSYSSWKLSFMIICWMFWSIHSRNVSLFTWTIGAQAEPQPCFYRARKSMVNDLCSRLCITNTAICKGRNTGIYLDFRIDSGGKLGAKARHPALALMAIATGLSSGKVCVFYLFQCN